MVSPPEPARGEACAGSSRRDRRRDRHGRGGRGPLLLPSPLAPHGVPAMRPSRSAFDRTVLGVVDLLERHRPQLLSAVEVAVEDAPVVPDDWGTSVPLASVVDRGRSQPALLVLFRRPIEHRSLDRTALRALVREVVLERLREVGETSSEGADPRPERPEGAGPEGGSPQQR